MSVYGKLLVCSNTLSYEAEVNMLLRMSTGLVGAKINTSKHHTNPAELDDIMACTECKVKMPSAIDCHTLIKLWL